MEDYRNHFASRFPENLRRNFLCKDNTDMNISKLKCGGRNLWKALGPGSVATAEPGCLNNAAAGKIMKKKIILLVFNLWFLTCNAPGGVINVSDYGALGDGKTVNTDAIQKAIDDCHESGGGKLLFSNGNYVTGTIFLKSNVILHIEAGASLSGSTNISDYSPNVFRNQYAREPHMDRCLIFAENANNIGIEGRGTVNGQERARGHIFILDRKQGSDLGMEDRIH